MQEPPLTRGTPSTSHKAMHKTTRHAFEIQFFESILRRNPSDTNVIEILGGLYTKEGRIDEGLRMDRRLVRRKPDNATAYYNLACSLALKKRRADAMRMLERAVELGYKDVDWMLQDPDLDSLKKHPAFRALAAKLVPEH